MKTTLFWTALILSFVASAQQKGQLEMGFGLGVNMASVSDEYDNSDTRYGFNAAASADYYFSDSWSIKAKLIYDQKGWNNGALYDTSTADFFPTDYQLTYITVPVMAGWHFAPKRNWYLNFGLYAGFLTSAEATNFNYDVKDQFNPTDFGVALAVGVKIPVNDKIKIFVEYDGQGGFNDIFKDNFDSAVTTGRSAINVGINFLAN